MKKFKSLLLIISIAFTTSEIFSQANPSAGILPLNAGGIVAVGAIQDVQVSIANTLSGNIIAFKLRPIITIPANCTVLPDAQQTGLPPGWVIVTNTPATGQIRVCNGTDVIGGFQNRDIIIKVQGTTIGGPAPCAVQINYGGASCAVSGPQPTGNLPADDAASSSITVIEAPLPLTLLSFNATLLNCKPSLNWITESEINTDRFEVERANLSNSDWTTVGFLSAKGNASKKAQYSLADKDVNISSEKVLYRLKMIDKDGSYKYSEVLRVNVNCKTTQVDVYPNPVQNGKLYISLSGASENAQAALLSVSGQVILKNKINNGTNFLSTTNIADGIYILNITDANGLDKKVKVLIQH